MKNKKVIVMVLVLIIMNVGLVNASRFFDKERYSKSEEFGMDKDDDLFDFGEWYREFFSINKYEGRDEEIDRVLPEEKVYIEKEVVKERVIYREEEKRKDYPILESIFAILIFSILILSLAISFLLYKKHYRPENIKDIR